MLQVSLQSDKQYGAKVIGYDEDKDVAVLQVLGPTPDRRVSPKASILLCKRLLGQGLPSACGGTSAHQHVHACTELDPKRFALVQQSPVCVAQAETTGAQRAQPGAAGQEVCARGEPGAGLRAGCG